LRFNDTANRIVKWRFFTAEVTERTEFLFEVFSVLSVFSAVKWPLISLRILIEPD